MRSAVGVIPVTAPRALVGLNRTAMSSTRRRVLALYKELHRLGRDYPDPKYPFLFISCIHPKLIHGCLAHSYDFNARIRRMFESLSHHFQADLLS
jgi:hypothetical protein